MLIQFESTEGPNVLMADDIAMTLLEKMGMSRHVPGAVLAKDLPVALAKLKAALSSGDEQVLTDEVDALPYDELISERVHLATRAQPLIELLAIAGAGGGDVIWDRYHPSPLLTWP